jgi:hypothetical protein
VKFDALGFAVGVLLGTAISAGLWWSAYKLARPALIREIQPQVAAVILADPQIGPLLYARGDILANVTAQSIGSAVRTLADRNLP